MRRFKAILILSLLFSSATAFADCNGYSGPGGPCYTGPGGQRYDRWNRPSPNC
jgi:hypothetical protein